MALPKVLVPWAATAAGVVVVHALGLVWWLTAPVLDHRVEPAPRRIEILTWPEPTAHPGPTAPPQTAPPLPPPKASDPPLPPAQPTASPEATTTAPPEQPPVTAPPPEAPVAPETTKASPEPEYPPMVQGTVAPVIPARELLGRIRYPEKARKQGIQGTVGLELFIDHTGSIRRIEVLSDPGWGFARAAIEALEGLTCQPAQSEGRPVAVRYRYPVRFTLR